MPLRVACGNRVAAQELDHKQAAGLHARAQELVKLVRLGHVCH